MLSAAENRFMKAWSRTLTAKAVARGVPKLVRRSTAAPSYTPRPFGENGTAFARLAAKRTKAVSNGLSDTPSASRKIRSVITSKTHIEQEIMNNPGKAIPVPLIPFLTRRTGSLSLRSGPPRRPARRDGRNQNTRAAIDMTASDAAPETAAMCPAPVEPAGSISRQSPERDRRAARSRTLTRTAENTPSARPKPSRRLR